MQYKYCAMSQELKVNSQWNLVSWYRIWREKYFFKNHAENEAGRLVADLYFFFEKALYELKANDQHLNLKICWYSSTWTYNKNKFHKMSNPWSKDMFDFDFLEKDLGIVSPTHFVYDFLRKNIFHSIFC